MIALNLNIQIEDVLPSGASNIDAQGEYLYGILTLNATNKVPESPYMISAVFDHKSYFVDHLFNDLCMENESLIIKRPDLVKVFKGAVEVTDYKERLTVLDSLDTMFKLISKSYVCLTKETIKDKLGNSLKSSTYEYATGLNVESNPILLSTLRSCWGLS